MKRLKIIFIIFLLTIPITFFPINDYVELNDLAIIESIGVSYNNDEYSLYLKEIIPIKGDGGIKYQYKYYKSVGESLEKAQQSLNKTAKKKLYLSKAKLLITNCKTSNDILKKLKIKNLKIYHVSNNVFKKLKEN